MSQDQYNETNITTGNESPITVHGNLNAGPTQGAADASQTKVAIKHPIVLAAIVTAIGIVAVAYISLQKPQSPQPPSKTNITSPSP